VLFSVLLTNKWEDQTPNPLNNNHMCWSPHWGLCWYSGLSLS